MGRQEGGRRGGRGLPSWTACTSAPLSENDWLFRRSDRRRRRRRRRHRTRPTRPWSATTTMSSTTTMGYAAREENFLLSPLPPPPPPPSVAVAVVRPSLLPGYLSGPCPKHSGFNGRSCPFMPNERTRWSGARGYHGGCNPPTMCLPSEIRFMGLSLHWFSPRPIPSMPPPFRTGTIPSACRSCNVICLLCRETSRKAIFNKKSDMVLGLLGTPTTPPPNRLIVPSRSTGSLAPRRRPSEIEPRSEERRGGQSDGRPASVREASP